MFKVIEKQTEEVLTVYGTHIGDFRETLFLLHRYNQWIWVKSENFIPYE
jgi:hypothetical protein